MDETLIRHDYLECSNESSEKCYLVALTRDASGSHQVTSAYGKIGGSLRSSAKVVGTDLRGALATYETTVNQKLGRGYQVERLVSPRREVADWLIDLGARATDIWSPLRGLAIEPEERAARLPVGAVASPTLRKRLVPSERTERPLRAPRCSAHQRAKARSSRMPRFALSRRSIARSKAAPSIPSRFIRSRISVALRGRKAVSRSIRAPMRASSSRS